MFTLTHGTGDLNTQIVNSAAYGSAASQCILIELMKLEAFHLSASRNQRGVRRRVESQHALQDISTVA